MRMPSAVIALLLATGTAHAHPGHGGSGVWHHGEPILLILLAAGAVAAGACVRAVRAHRGAPRR